MAAFDPGFGTEVFKIDPDAMFCGHALDKAFGRVTGEGFDHDFVGLQVGRFDSPVHQVDAPNDLPILRRVDAGFDFGEAVQVVDPQAHVVAAGHIRQLPRQAPADADIAKIVDDRTENIPAMLHAGAGSGSARRT